MEILFFILLRLVIHVTHAAELDPSLLMGKIVNGSDATNDQVTYMASLQINKKNPDEPDVPVWIHYCGAGVIGPRFLLTAARCLHYLISYGGDHFVDASALIGTIDLSTGGRRISIRLVKHNNLYCNHDPESSSKNDYGVVLLKDEIAPEDKSWLIIQRIQCTGNHASLAGWGCDVDEVATVTFETSCVSNILKQVDLVTKSLTVCKIVFPAISDKTSELCGRLKYKKLGLRDIGGPLVISDEEHGQKFNNVIGITTGMTEYKDGFFYIRFVRIDTIESKIGKIKAALLEDEQSRRRARHSIIDLNTQPDPQPFTTNAD